MCRNDRASTSHGSTPYEQQRGRAMDEKSPTFHKACRRLLGSDSEFSIAVAKRFDPVLYARIEAVAVRLQLEAERKLVRRRIPIPPR